MYDSFDWDGVAGGVFMIVSIVVFVGVIGMLS